MWEAIKAIAELGVAVIGLFRSSGVEQKTAPTYEVPATPRDIAISQESGATASREGKLAARKAKEGER